MTGRDAVVRTREVGLIAAFAALAALTRVAFLFFPNGSPIYFVVFIAGAAFGLRVGAASGFLAMALTDLALTGVHPILLVNAGAMAAIGAAGSLAGRVMDLGHRGRGNALVVSGIAGFLGLGLTLFFSILSDAFSWLLFDVPSGAGSMTVLGAVVAAGLVFNIPAAAASAATFAVGTWPTMRALAQADLLAEPLAVTPAVDG